MVESGLKADRDGAGTVRRRGWRFLSILEVNLLVLKERGGKKGLRVLERMVVGLSGGWVDDE